jgi:cell division protease FtsH
VARSWLYARLVIAYGGYVAEKLVYGETTTGTSQDLKQATDMARRMVCEWGMAEGVGPIALGQEDEPIFLGKEIAQHKDYSEETARHIDEAIKAILDKALAHAFEILERERQKLDALTDELMLKETLEDADVRSLLGFPPKQVAQAAEA